MTRLAVPLFASFCLLLAGGAQGRVAGADKRQVEVLNSNEDDAKAFLNTYNEMAMVVYFEDVTAAWTYQTDITEEHQQKMIEANLISAAFQQEARTNASVFDRTGFSEDTVRQLENLLYIGDSALENEDLEDLNNVLASMETRYSTGEVCMNDECYSLEPDLTRIIAESRNYHELYWAWDGWRDEVGGPAREDYKEYVRLKNKAAVANDQEDCGAWWRSWYEVEDLEADVLKLYSELKPFYQQLHAYVRRKLHGVYGDDFINLEAPIPAHLLGNMWAQSWLNLLDICEPYKGKPNIDITPALREQGYDAKRMFETSDEFFASLGLIEMPEEFWDHSVIEKLSDREMVCHASAWDFYNQKDFRVKQCTDITQSHFITVHHEMGHVEYFLQYKDLPVVYRGGANPGFHEAVGDVLALSVSTPQHLFDIGLLDEVVDDPEADLNYLMSIALDKIAFLPFAILMDQWRWDIFDGSSQDETFNADWWKLRLDFQGLIPPTERSEADFDPAAKYHIPSSTPYIRYFISHILQFQFHEALCNASGHEGPLLKCDIYQSQEAGKLLGDMLKLGSSVPWPEAMEKITGQREMSALPLVKYFEPLMRYLEEENARMGETIGWPNTEWKPEDPRNHNEEDAIEFLDTFNEMAMEVYFEDVSAAWTYQTDITEEHQQKMIEANLKSAAFEQEARTNASAFDLSGFTDNTVRQLENLLYIGDSALEDQQDLQDLNNVLASLETRYSTGEVCLNDDDCYSLEPDLTRVLAESRNYGELYWAWDGWRDEVGGPAREDYKEYVRLKNKAAQANDQDDCGAWWRSWYEVDDLEADVLKLYNELKPFYQQLHAYVRRKLHGVYGDDFVNLKAPIPAHLLGNMWAQSWLNLLDICEPYDGKPTIDITPALQKQGYDAKRMFETSDEFFTSLGLIEMPQEFWDHSVIEKIPDKEMVCHASAWDFNNQKDFRVKQCTDITQDDFITVHHEMGHIEYYLQYKDQPVVFRGGANPGFHEAVGDVLALSVSTPQHLYDIGLLDEVADDPEADINYLMSIALDKIAFLPFAILMDQWRWGLFDGSTQDETFNQDWWKLRLEFQGLLPPTERSEADFDPAAKYHIPSDTPYIRYFVSHILQFQFHEALCNASGHTGPLLKCDIYKSQEAGKLLGDMLKLGSSMPWPDAMEKITGQREMSALPLVKYFEPLMRYLEEENARMDETIGWPDTEWKPEAPPEWNSATSLRMCVVTMFIAILLVFLLKF